MGDPIASLAEGVDFEIFRNYLESVYNVYKWIKRLFQIRDGFFSLIKFVLLMNSLRQL